MATCTGAHSTRETRVPHLSRPSRRVGVTENRCAHPHLAFEMRTGGPFIERHEGCPTLRALAKGGSNQRPQRLPHISRLRSGQVADSSREIRVPHPSRSSRRVGVTEDRAYPHLAFEMWLNVCKQKAHAIPTSAFGLSPAYLGCPKPHSFHSFSQTHISATFVGSGYPS